MKLEYRKYYGFASESDFNGVVNDLMNTSKETLVHLVITGQVANKRGFYSNELERKHVRSLLSSIEVDELLEQERVLLDKLDDNILKSKGLLNQKDFIKWAENQEEYDRLNAEITKIDKRIDRIHKREDSVQ